MAVPLDLLRPIYEVQVEVTIQTNTLDRVAFLVCVCFPKYDNLLPRTNACFQTQSDMISELDTLVTHDPLDAITHRYEMLA